MKPAIRRIAYRIGFRGLGLIAFTATCWLYGSGLLLGYHPTFNKALGLTTREFGIAFISLGAISLIGVLTGDDRYFYAISALGITAWVLVLSLYWTAPYGWTAAVSWMSVAAALIIASAWPEPVLPKNGMKDEIEKQVEEVRSAVANGEEAQ